MRLFSIMGVRFGEEVCSHKQDDEAIRILIRLQRFYRRSQ